MMLIDAVETRNALAFDRLIPALKDMFISGCTVPLRHTHSMTNALGEAVGSMLIMPAWQAGGYLGVKTVTIFPANASLSLPGLHSTYTLYDAKTGVPLAQIDGNEITSRRTAAASALAAAYLAPVNARHLLIVGTGRVGSLLAQAYREVRPIQRVTVWDRNKTKADNLAEQLISLGFDATSSSDLADAAAQADIVSCATLATEPVVQGIWLRPTSHLDLIGSFTPDMREADDNCFAGETQIYVDTLEALQKSGELLGPMSRGIFKASDMEGTISDLTSGKVPGRGNFVGRTVFKSVGNALEDLAAAVLVFESHQT